MEQWATRWPHFPPEEVLSPDGMQQARRGNLMLQPHALDALERVRVKLDFPLYVNCGRNKRRGYRSAHENALVGGSKFSRHVQGIAFDISCRDPEALIECAIDEGFGFALKYDTFVHIDMRPRL